MPTNRFKARLKRIQYRFNETLGRNPSIKPEIRRSVIFSIIKLGLLERKISADLVAKDIREFTRIANVLEKVFANIHSLNTRQTKE